MEIYTGTKLVESEQQNTNILYALKQVPAELNVKEFVYLVILERLQRQPRTIWPLESRKEWSKI